MQKRKEYILTNLLWPIVILVSLISLATSLTLFGLFLLKKDGPPEIEESKEKSNQTESEKG